MDDPVIVTRDADFDVPADDLWQLVADGSSWGEWLGEQANVELAPGAAGTVRDDDGVDREVHIERVDRGEGIRFTWWPTAHPHELSRVELTVVELPRGRSTLRISEILGRASHARASTGLAWDLRILMLWVRASCLAPV